LWLQPLIVPSSPSFLVHNKFVVPFSHSKSELGQDLVWTEWLFAGWLLNSEVLDESSAVCNYSDEFVQLGVFLCNFFCRL
jgi:hypothetical protein